MTRAKRTVRMAWGLAVLLPQIGDDALVHRARRHGVGAAVTLAAMREARARGDRYGILSAGSMGESGYRRLGFVEYCRIDTYLGLGATPRL